MMGDDPKFFETPDPWFYQSTPDDLRRKQIILHTLQLFGSFDRALDLGAHEGWITKDLPAHVKHGYELSDIAASRFPPNVYRAVDGKYDLVITTGTLYAHYDWQEIVNMIREHASSIVLTCNIKAWEVSSAIAGIPGRQEFEAEFPYRGMTQKLRVFQIWPY